VEDGDVNLIKNNALFAVAVSRRRVGTNLEVYGNSGPARALMEAKLHHNDEEFLKAVPSLARPDYRAHWEKIREQRFGPDYEAIEESWAQDAYEVGLFATAEVDQDDWLDLNGVVERWMCHREMVEEAQDRQRHALTKERLLREAEEMAAAERRAEAARKIDWESQEERAREIERQREANAVEAARLAREQLEKDIAAGEQRMRERLEANLRKAADSKKNLDCALRTLSTLNNLPHDLIENVVKLAALCRDPKTRAVDIDQLRRMLHRRLGESFNEVRLEAGILSIVSTRLGLSSEEFLPKLGEDFNTWVRRIGATWSYKKEVGHVDSLKLSECYDLLKLKRWSLILGARRKVIHYREQETRIALESREQVSLEVSRIAEKHLKLGSCLAGELKKSGHVCGLLSKDGEVIRPGIVGGIGMYGPDLVPVTRSVPVFEEPEAVCVLDEGSFVAPTMSSVERGSTYTDLFRPESELSEGYDAYKLGCIIDPHVGQNHRTNEVGAAVGPTKLLVGMRLRRDPLYMKLTSKGLPAIESDFGRAFSGGFGNTQTTSTVECLGAAERYLVKPKGSRSSVDGRRHAIEVAKLNYKEHFLREQQLDIVERQAVLADFLTKVRERNYSGRLAGYVKACMNRFGVSFTNKRQFKVCKSNMFEVKRLDKVGQGISATSPYVNMLYGNLMRQADHEYARRGKHYNIMDCYLTEDQLMERVKRENDLLPTCATLVTTDAEEFDSGQNWWSARGEAWENAMMVGHFEDFEGYVERVRTNYKLECAGLFSGVVRQAKPSGAPDTLGGNTRVSSRITNYIVRGRGPCMLVKKGDDHSKRQYGQRLDRDRARTLSLYSPIKLKVAVGDTQFCGKTMTNAGLFDNILGMARKALAHWDKEYRTWAEYQLALRDAHSRIRKSGVVGVVAATALACGVTEEVAWRAYGVFQSLCHISEEQWREGTQIVRLTAPVVKNAKGEVRLN